MSLWSIDKENWLPVHPSEMRHVIPVDDLVEHERALSCVCGPETEPVMDYDGLHGWLVTHHSLDGRESNE